ncbi:hypothetical protein FRC03_012319 [Tulasnella sp. 419]|nr:hypothetical protein FRC03_012319 [Tulasnella sp. 419]
MMRSPLRKIYHDTPINFEDLAKSYPPLQPHVFIDGKGMPNINFKDMASQRRVSTMLLIRKILHAFDGRYLTEALLRRDFGLSLTLPPGRLCPPVPNRLAMSRVFNFGGKLI